MNFEPFPTLYTNNFLLRELILEDIEQIYILKSDPEKNKYIDRPLYQSREEAQNFISFIQEGIKNVEWIYWGISYIHSKELIGTICIWNLNWEERIGEIGFELDSKYFKKGIMSEVLPIILRYGFHSMNLKRIDAFTHKENKASIKLLEKFNFKLDASRVDQTNPNNLIYTIQSSSY